MIEQRKPLWPWIVALPILLPGLYVASFGPACWITSWSNGEKSLLPVVYWPVLKLICWKEHDLASRPPEGDFWNEHSDGTWLSHGPFCWYAGVGAREGAHWFYTVRYEKNRGQPTYITREEWEWR